MGRASRKRAEKRAMKPSERKALNEMLRESTPQVFGNDKGQITYYNPLKKLLKQEAYKSEEGFAVTNEMVRKYNAFIKAKIKNDLDRKEEESGN